MRWKQWIIIFLIMFVGMCSIVTVDQECLTCTGKGGKVGLSVSRTVKGDMAVCFFGLEREIDL